MSVLSLVYLLLLGSGFAGLVYQVLWMRELGFLFGNAAYVSGHGPVQTDGTLMVGRVGSELDEEAGYQAARQTGLAILATLQGFLGDLEKIDRVVKLLGMVNSTPDFENHPAVINGCSELFRDVFGEDHGVGTRSAVGMGSLPGNITVEIEGAVLLK